MSMDSHEHDHSVLILRRSGRALLGTYEIGVSFGDIIYVASLEVHQFKSVGSHPLRFLCVVPARSEGE